MRGNHLLYGDNLHWLREMDRESVDLIYLDPPFNSNATYNLLFRTRAVKPSKRKPRLSEVRGGGIGRLSRHSMK